LQVWKKGLPKDVEEYLMKYVGGDKNREEALTMLKNDPQAIYRNDKNYKALYSYGLLVIDDFAYILSICNS